MATSQPSTGSLVLRRLSAAAAFALASAFALPAAAGLTTFQSFTGKVAASVDAWGHSNPLPSAISVPINGGPSSGASFPSGNPVPGIFFEIPQNAMVLAAYFYTATENTLPNPGTVTIGNQVIGPTDWDAQYTNDKPTGGPAPPNPDFFRMGRKDVTQLIQDVVAGQPAVAAVSTKFAGAGSGGKDLYELYIEEPSSPRCSNPMFPVSLIPLPNTCGINGLGFPDPSFGEVLFDDHSGETLVVVYQDNSLPEQTVVILDGSEQGTAANPLGDSASVDFGPAGLNVDIDGSLGAELSLGISFSAESGANPQQTEVDVGGAVGAEQPLTTNAGGSNDNVDRNEISYGGVAFGEPDRTGVANLITAGGVGDTILVCDPGVAPPCGAGDSVNDNQELYDISAYFTPADSVFSMTSNPVGNSADENLFLAVLTMRSQMQDGGGPGPMPMPAPASLLLAAIGLSSAFLLGRRRRLTASR